MALSKPTIKAAIKKITTDLNSGDVTKKDPDQVVDDFADKLADVIINAIKSGTVTIAPGAITTTGSATTQTNPTPVTGTIS